MFSLIDAFKTSSNIVPLKISEEEGLKRIIEIANIFGLGTKHKLQEFLPLAIGAYGDSLINITNAYSAINNDGKFIKPSIIEKIELQNKNIIWENKFLETRIINSSISKQLKILLEKSVYEGNGNAAAISGQKIFGKTGTSDQNKDLWFIGSIGNTTTGIWLGFDDNRESNLSSGNAANIWKIYTKEILNIGK